ESLFEAILPVHFNDINEEDDYWGLSDKEQAEMKLFNEVHRDLIYNFVDEHPDFTQIVVHCHAGVSRSSAVAMAIAEHLRDTDTYEKLQVIKRYLPNPRVLAIMRGEAYL
ncbi:dual specificity protein phosphatase family protein, partial [Listeria monocytogenes]|nr:dual specificity protein phosphatase family protein [Listeria monocytogenes]